MRIVRTLGSGASGVVQKAFLPRESRFVAIKKISVLERDKRHQVGEGCSGGGTALGALARAAARRRCMWRASRRHDGLIAPRPPPIVPRHLS